jgi:excisionase family DNA binding protein
MAEGIGRLLTPEEVCKIFSISMNTLRRWVAARKIPSIQVGRGLRFTEASISWFIDKKTRKAIA